MISQSEHIEKAQHDEDFINSFDASSTPFRDWVVTGIFYAALHYVDSYLASINVHPGNHSVRDRWFREPELDPIFFQYRILKDESNLARYDVHQFGQQDVQDHLSYLRKIKNHLSRFVSQIPS